VRIQYDRAGRSEGAAIITYNRIDDARTAIKEFDGANAKGQPIRLTLLPPGGGNRGGRNPFDHVEKPKRSLFERIERPRDRGNRSLSPESDREHAAGGRRRRGHGGAASRRSDVTKPAPEHIDRYVPGQRSPAPRTGAGRRPGERRDDKRRDGQGRQAANGRPKKTQEELDREMEDYWGTANAGTTGTETSAAAPAADQTAPASAAATGLAHADDDIDMIE
jgi:THO complex subunit 4